MNKHLRRAMAMLEAARPASGFRPETPEEWNRLLRAEEEICYAVSRKAGLADLEARQLARQIFGGSAGMLLLNIAFSEVNDE